MIYVLVVSLALLFSLISSTTVSTAWYGSNGGLHNDSLTDLGSVRYLEWVKTNVGFIRITNVNFNNVTWGNNNNTLQCNTIDLQSLLVKSRLSRKKGSILKVGRLHI